MKRKKRKEIVWKGKGRKGKGKRKKKRKGKKRKERKEKKRKGDEKYSKRMFRGDRAEERCVESRTIQDQSNFLPIFNHVNFLNGTN